MTQLDDLSLAARIARRDMRGGVRALALLVAGVFVGAAAVALVGSASQSLIDASRQGALEVVGGDISLRSFHMPPGAAQVGEVQALAEAVSVTAELRPMAHGVRSRDGAVSGPVLVELKGVDRNYPLYGQVRVEPHADLHQILEQREDGIYGAVADQALFDALQISSGDSLKIGSATYRLRGVLTSEPDRAFRAFTLGPRVIVASESLAMTGVAHDGAPVYYYTRARLSAGADTKAALDKIDAAFPDAGWRMVDAREGVPGIERTLAMAHVLLLFIGLGVMLVGGAGISGAVRAHVDAKMETIAILKSIGASPGLVTLAVGLEAMAAAAFGAVLGVALGALGPSVAGLVLGDQLPFALDGTVALKPLVAAALFGVLTAALFAWWPLAGIQNMNARILLRERAWHDPARPGKGAWAGAAVLVGLLVAVLFWSSPMPLVTSLFLLGALALAFLYAFMGRMLARVARVLAPGKAAGVRLALGNLYRPGAPTGPVVMALGLTLTLLVALEGLGQAVSQHVRTTLPRSAPDLVAFSLQPDQAAAFTQALGDWAGTDRLRVMPFLHARVQAINDVPVRALKIPGSLGWVIRGDRGVSFAATPPAGSRLVAGRWWTDPEVPALSLDDGVARTLGLGIGDMLTLNVAGHVVSAPVANLRAIDWTGLDLDFPIIASPGALVRVPHTFAASLKAHEGLGADMEAFVHDRFPDVPLIRVADVLDALARAIGIVVAGLQGAALLCGLAALVVLAGSVLQGLSGRTDEVLLFKVLGARRGQVLGHLALEFAVLGTLVALVAAPLGLGVAYGVARALGLDVPHIALGGPLAIVAAAVAVTVLAGLTATLGAYLAPAAAYLRNRGV